jgi:hypothetical protein
VEKTDSSEYNTAYSSDLISCKGQGELFLQMIITWPKF